MGKYMKMEIRFRNRGSKENSTIILREIVTSFKIETTYKIYGQARNNPKNKKYIKGHWKVSITDFDKVWLKIQFFGGNIWHVFFFKSAIVHVDRGVN